MVVIDGIIVTQRFHETFQIPRNYLLCLTTFSISNCSNVFDISTVSGSIFAAVSLTGERRTIYVEESGGLQDIG